ncbi:unnamed protein product [Zymoseptoria tritici ST99CH_1A5]|uniref:Uncharacterized protein n=3 Tax=Zymoseptoria tritici TaxID=1047171 RepID=A0A1X7S8F2_ZYMT9|nr:unnamed protein product [Zymoseptoria tritici ST99CH_3D7]SMR61159.1 unnamed protein product [Zymoseptoria tritici ST99CH_1E4]SMR64309.1 unnamed protein product [Zymoseptoria tritici ST99CH_3D1]SMY29654.1 unnamed protein product [Zymoseptoria tritici ST99CH_1A5]
MSSLEIVTGYWIDYGKSPFHRARLTLTTNESNLLLVALAVLTALTGEYLWQILCQLMFLRRATDEARDGLFHQTQLSLRNDDSPGEFSWSMFRLGVAWGKRRSSFRWRAFRWAVFGLVMLILNNASSFWLPVLASEGEVLIKGTPNEVNWTRVDFPDPKTQKDVMDQDTRERMSIMSSGSKVFSSYAASCYPDLNAEAGFNRIGSNMCGWYVQRYLNTSVAFPRVCPFAQDLCAVPSDQVIRVDSGRINSHDHLGINSPPNARVEIETSITCSPLRTDGYMTPDYINHNGVNDTLLFYYGDNWLANPARLMNDVYNSALDNGTNITYYYTRAQEIAKEQPIALFVATEDLLNAFFRVPQFNMSSTLRTSDARVTIFFLGNRLELTAAASDPWFNNTRISQGGDGSIYYGAYKPVSPLGCTQTHAFCNPNTNLCVEQNIAFPPYFTGRSNDPLWDKLALSPEQRLVAEMMIFASRASVLGELVVNSPASDLLLIYRMVSDTDTTEVSLPDDHWHREVRNFMNMALSKMQGVSMSFVTPPTPIARQWGAINSPPLDPTMAYISARVKIRSHSHQSFSVAALALVIALQGMIILAGLYMQFVWPWLRLRKPDDSPNHNRGYKIWQLMGAVQLHRCLHQLLGRGRWRGAWHQIPTTDPGSLFSEYGKLPWQPYVTLEQEQALSKQAEGDAHRHGGVTTTEVKGSLDGKCEDSGANSSVDTLKHA